MTENENLFLTYLHDITICKESGNYMDALPLCTTVAEMCCAADHDLLNMGIEPCAERISNHPRLAIEYSGKPGMHGKPILTPEEIYHLRDILYPPNAGSDENTTLNTVHKRTSYTFATWYFVNSYDASVRTVYKDISPVNLIDAILETAHAFYSETPELASKIGNHMVPNKTERSTTHVLRNTTN